MAIENRKIGRLLDGLDAKRVMIRPKVRMKWSGAKRGIDLTRVKAGRVPTGNVWTVGWCPHHKSFAAYRFNRREGHRAWLFHNVGAAKWFVSFLEETDWVAV